MTSLLLSGISSTLTFPKIPALNLGCLQKCNVYKSSQQFSASSSLSDAAEKRWGLTGRAEGSSAASASAASASAAVQHRSAVLFSRSLSLLYNHTEGTVTSSKHLKDLMDVCSMLSEDGVCQQHQHSFTLQVPMQRDS